MRKGFDRADTLRRSSRVTQSRTLLRADSITPQAGTANSRRVHKAIGHLADGSLEQHRPSRGLKENCERFNACSQIQVPEKSVCVAELAKRDWDAIVVGGGHNGLTAAAYLARAGDRSSCSSAASASGAPAPSSARSPTSATWSAPAPTSSACSTTLVIRELELERRGLRYWMADPNLWVPVRRRHGIRPVARRRAHPAEPRASSASRRSDIEGYWAYEELFDEIRRKLRQGSRDTWVGDAPSRAEIEELLERRPGMIDLVFEASIADVLDDHLSDERLKTRCSGRAIIGTWGGPQDPGTASIKLMHFQGDMDGQGPALGIRRGRHGDGQLRDRRRGARGGRDARLRRAGGRDRPRARASSSRTARRSAPGR